MTKVVDDTAREDVNKASRVVDNGAAGVVSEEAGADAVGDVA